MSKLKIQATSADRRESDTWLETYASEQERQRRRSEMPAKLRRLGLTDEFREQEILDMCCGHGEALDVLHEMNFRKLSGIDITVTEALARDSRFRIIQGDVTKTGLPDASYDWIICVHSLHHLANAETVARFVDESWRLLRPGGRLSIIDFPGSPQIKLAFWFFRQPMFHVTRYLKYFGRIIQEEWSFLRYYLPQWPTVRSHLWRGRFQVERSSSSLFYYYLTLRKPESAR
jgi:SAM-dependent methyltransferase